MNLYLDIIDLEGTYNGATVQLGWRGGILGDYLLGDLLAADGETIVAAGVTAKTDLIVTAADLTVANVRAAYQTELGMTD